MLGLKLNHVSKRGHCYDQHRKIGKKPLSAEQNSKHNNISKPIYRGDHKLGIQSLLWLRSLRAPDLQNITQNNTCWIHRWIRRIHIYKRSIGNLSYIYGSQWLTFQWHEHFITCRYCKQALRSSVISHFLQSWPLLAHLDKRSIRGYLGNSNTWDYDIDII